MNLKWRRKNHHLNPRNTTYLFENFYLSEMTDLWLQRQQNLPTAMGRPLRGDAETPTSRGFFEPSNAVPNWMKKVISPLNGEIGKKQTGCCNACSSFFTQEELAFISAHLLFWKTRQHANWIPILHVRLSLNVEVANICSATIFWSCGGGVESKYVSCEVYGGGFQWVSSNENVPTKTLSNNLLVFLHWYHYFRIHWRVGKRQAYWNIVH